VDGHLTSATLAMGLFAIAALPLARRAAGPRIPLKSRIVATASGVAYGIAARVIAGIDESNARDSIPGWLATSFGVMSVSFLVLIPVVIGVLDQLPEPPPQPSTWRRIAYAFFSPMTAVSLLLALMAIFTWEGTICIVMALPIFFVLAGLGGCIGMLVRTRTARSRNATVSALVLLPYLTSPVEHRLDVSIETRTVENVVRVRSAPEVVWREIKSVRAIDPEELPFRFAHFIGLPRPVEATLSHDGLGGVRVATFERGLSFRETVTEWAPNRMLSFSIHAEPAPPGALDEHVAVGGPYFDVLDGTYVLEPLPDGTTRLRLTSHQRLSTRFNVYARLWTDLVMSDLQSAIMEVIRKRCEGTPL
jgi:succinate-acetate transporter protein